MSEGRQPRPPDHPGGRPRRLGWTFWWPSLMLAAVGALLLGGSAAVGLLIGSRVAPADDAAVAWVAGLRSDGLTTAMATFTDLGSIHTLGPVVAVAALWLLLRRRPAEALAALVATLGVVVLVDAAKLLVGRLRPAIDPVLDVGSPSFPSGHAAQSAAVLLVLAAVLTNRKPARAAALLLAVVLSIGVGATRVYLGVHYPSDVLAGWLLGAAWAFAVLRAIVRPERRARGGTPMLDGTSHGHGIDGGRTNVPGAGSR